jgi:hypothetical protein
MRLRDGITAVIVALCMLAADTGVGKLDAKELMRSYSFRFAFANKTTFFANDFHATFRGTGGTLHNPRITRGPKNAQITAHDNQVDIFFPTPVAPGGLTGFSVVSNFRNVQFDSGYWTLWGFPLLPPAVPNPRP